jgi:hypothetical protein
MKEPLEAVRDAVAAVEEASESAVSAGCDWKVRRELLEAAAYMIRAKALLMRAQMEQRT